MKDRLVTLRRAALLVALVLLVLGVGGQDAVAPEVTPELDVIVAVDRTTSMSALDDPSGSRITAVRRDLSALVDAMGPARFSLVTFGRTASLRLPMTSDRVTFRDEAEVIQVEGAVDGAGSSVGIGVPLLQRLFGRAARAARDDDAERRPVLVLVTDGESTSSKPQLSFTKLGRLTTAAVVLGYGTTDGGVMPLQRVDLDDPPPPADDPGPVVTDRQTGETAISRKDPQNLQLIADQLDAPLVSPTGPQDMADVATALTETAYADLAPGRPSRETRWLWALLVLALALPELRRGWQLWLSSRRDSVNG